MEYYERTATLRSQSDPATHSPLDSLCWLTAPGFYLSCSLQLGQSLPCPRSIPLSFEVQLQWLLLRGGLPQHPRISPRTLCARSTQQSQGTRPHTTDFPPALAPRAGWARGVS